MNPQEQHEYDNAIQKEHTIFLDHYPINNQKVIDIYNALKKKRPDLIVNGVCRQTRMVGGVGSNYYDAYRGLTLAYANLPTQTVGEIGFEYDQYFVSSRLIQNARYSPWSGRDYHTKKSKHMNNIVKEALKVLLPTQFKEVFDESSNLVEQNISKIREKARDGLNRKVGFIGREVWRNELLHMAKMGYTPDNSEVASAMEYVVDTQEEYERNADYNPDKMFVWIKPECVMYGDGKTLEEFKSTDELPEAVRGKLFVLMVTDPKVFVDEVGMKFTDNKFWVLV